MLMQCPVETVEKLVVPWDKYLQQWWSEVLERVEIIKEWRDQEACYTAYTLAVGGAVLIQPDNSDLHHASPHKETVYPLPSRVHRRGEGGAKWA